jgi:hypothetical protein
MVMRNLRRYAAMGSGVSLVFLLFILQVDHFCGTTVIAEDARLVSATLSNQNYATYLNREQSRWNAYSAPLGLVLSQTTSNAAAQGQPQ